MLLLQLADIHFRHPDCGSDMDPERPYRTALLNDLRRQVEKLGPVDAVLVAGDIAYHGRKEEYEAALVWLTELTATAQCTLEDVFVVPGNHDVDRSSITGARAVQNVQAAVGNAVAQGREREVIDQFRDAEAGHHLLAPLAAYNGFAARFNCQVYAPEKLRWHQVRDLNDEFRLCIYGLTSTLLSGAGAPQRKEDTRLSLYLGSFQTAIDPIEGVVNLVMCHHPPDWFSDQDDVDDALKGRATLHLFGHKHRQRIHRDKTFVRFSAGAVNPDRSEPGWEPGYNLVRLTVKEEHGEYFLDVEAHLFCWQTNPDRFRAKVAEDEQSFFRHRIRLVRSRPSVTAARGGSARVPPKEEPDVPGASYAANQLPNDGEVAMSGPNHRNLVFRFWNLASSQRREIAMKFGLVSQEEMTLAEPERYGRALLRARERGVLDDVAFEVARLEGT